MPAWSPQSPAGKLLLTAPRLPSVPAVEVRTHGGPWHSPTPSLRSVGQKDSTTYCNLFGDPLQAEESPVIGQILTGSFDFSRYETSGPGNV